jgi:hypothetical protein
VPVMSLPLRSLRKREWIYVHSAAEYVNQQDAEDSQECKYGINSDEAGIGDTRPHRAGVHVEDDRRAKSKEESRARKPLLLLMPRVWKDSVASLAPLLPLSVFLVYSSDSPQSLVPIIGERMKEDGRSDRVENKQLAGSHDKQQAGEAVDGQHCRYTQGSALEVMLLRAVIGSCVP